MFKPATRVERAPFFAFTRVSFFKGAKQKTDLDINDQLRDLKESNIKITFSDIYADYKNYRKNFFFS